jgi:putative ABC transport system permease protein
VGGNNLLPFGGGGGSRSMLIEGQPVPPGTPHPEEQLRFITPGYFAALGIPLLRGRDFDAQDTDAAPPVAIVSRAMAARYWPGAEAVGKRIAYSGIGQGGTPKWIEVVGVVGDIKYRSLAEAERPMIYVSAYQPLFTGFTMPPLYVAVRTQGDAAALAASVRREVASIDPEQPVASLKTMRARLAESVAQRRFQMTLLSLFAALAILLATVGIYGVMAYSVAQRTHEIGVRMALGAQRADVLRLVVGQGIKLTLVGLALGLVSAFALTRIMATLLYGVEPTDPLTFAGGALVLAVIALIASYIPARRATRVDPMVALRYE